MNYEENRKLFGIDGLIEELDSLANYTSKNPYVSSLILTRMDEIEDAINYLEKKIKAL